MAKDSRSAPSGTNRNPPERRPKETLSHRRGSATAEAHRIPLRSQSDSLSYFSTPTAASRRFASSLPPCLRPYLTRGALSKGKLSFLLLMLLSCRALGRRWGSGGVGGNVAEGQADARCALRDPWCSLISLRITRFSSCGNQSRRL